MKQVLYVLVGIALGFVFWAVAWSAVGLPSEAFWEVYMKGPNEKLVNEWLAWSAACAPYNPVASLRDFHIVSVSPEWASSVSPAAKEVARGERWCAIDENISIAADYSSLAPWQQYGGVY